jgi:hypothetical protein
MSSAARQQRHRARERRGKVVLHIEADEVELIEALLIGGFLDPAHIDDRGRVERAVERLLLVLTSIHDGARF